jgi:hypothetical protein
LELFRGLGEESNIISEQESVERAIVKIDAPHLPKPSRQRLHKDREKHRRERTALADALMNRNRSTRVPVDNDAEADITVK